MSQAFEGLHENDRRIHVVAPAFILPPELADTTAPNVKADFVSEQLEP